MFKTTLTAAAFALIASVSHATQAPLDLAALASTADTATQIIDVNYYCEWVTLYDAWGNWVTVWQCY